jgi:hypothetical protein
MKSQKEGGSGPLRAVTPWKKKKKIYIYIYACVIGGREVEREIEGRGPMHAHTVRVTMFLINWDQ